jgi:hypothetical protein
VSVLLVVGEPIGLDAERLTDDHRSMVGIKRAMRWGLKNSTEKLEELRDKLDDVLVRIKDIERRLDENESRVTGVVQILETLNLVSTRGIKP